MEAKASLDQVSLSTLSICSCLAEHRDTTFHAALLFAVSRLLFAVSSVQKVPFPNVAVALTWDMCVKRFDLVRVRRCQKMTKGHCTTLHHSP